MTTLYSRVFIQIVTVNVVLSLQFFVAPSAYSELDGPNISAKNVEYSFSFNSEKIRRRIEEIKDELIPPVGPANIDETAVQFGVPFSNLLGYDATLRELEAVYQRQLTTSETIESLRKEEDVLGKALKANQQSLFAQPPPYNLSKYDSLLDQLTTYEKEEYTLLVNLKSVKSTLEDDKGKLEITQKKVRDLTEELEKTSNSDEFLLQSWGHNQAKVESELAQAFVDLKRMIIAETEAAQTLVQLKKQLLEHQVDWVRLRLAFDPGDLSKQLAALEARRLDLQSRLDKLKGEQAEVETAWITAQKELEETQGADEAVRSQAKAHLEAREAWRETYQKVIEQTENTLIILSQEKQLWQNRYDLLAQKIGYDQLDSWQKEARSTIKNIEFLIDGNDNYQIELQAEIAAIQKRVADKNIDPVIRKYIETRESALRKMAERIFEYLSFLQSIRRTEHRFLDEISLVQKNIALQKTINDLWTNIKKIWEFELWVVDDRSVTVEKVSVAFFILIVGMFLAWWFTQLLIRHILSKTPLDASGTAAVEKTLYFVVLITLIIFSLRSVNIPISVFTFLGGAIAIGVGFGAQNLLNNFISGVILLIERPVKINDLIEVENNFGIIEKIGMRCTLVRTPGDVHILVPNSNFLEKKIVNWTLSNQEIRAKVSVGVTHGNSAEASKLMLKAVSGHKKVLKEPEPIVLFDEIGESSLNFIVYFWISIKSLYLLERQIIESDIRFRIIELFHEAGMGVAHPQLDVHLDTVKHYSYNRKKENKKSQVP